MMKTSVIVGSLLFLLASAAFADDQLRSVQQYLKDQGFYYGQVNGEPGNDTFAAIKRFQIRNGLQVTGQINPETLAAMNQGGTPAAPSQAAPEIQPKIPVADQAPERPVVQQPQPGPPPTAASGNPVNPYSAFFRKTPFENAPGEVQQGTLRRAQIKLNRDGYYRGPIDGAPGPAIVQAISRYQADEGLAGTGRLDMDTLASLDLLPRNGPPRSYYPAEPAPGRPVYRGIWVH